VHTVLGLLGVALFIVCVISLAAFVTWAVVKISPTDKGDAAKQARPSP
jgi:hypothetical protein